MDFVGLLKKCKSVLLQQEVDSWEEAIKISGQKLIQNGMILPDYVDSIIEFTKKQGPYYIISEGLALPHSPNREAILEDGVSLVTLKNPVFFEGDSRFVNILVMLAIKGAKEHTSLILPQIVAIFEVEDNIKKILNCKKEQEVFEIIENIDYKKYLD